MKPQVIINGDDFGMNERCSRAIAQAFALGLITDATVMANGAYVEEAAALARQEGFLDRLGIHFNLTEDKPLTQEICRCAQFVRDGRFHKDYDWQQSLSAREQDAVCRELSAQADRLAQLGIVPTHADSHHYIHTARHVLPLVLRVCRAHGIRKIRLCRNLGDNIDAAYAAEINAEIRRQGFVTTAFFASLRRLGGADVMDNTEILVHPDFDGNGVLIDRAGVKDGVPFGAPLENLAISRFALTGYGAIE